MDRLLIDKSDSHIDITDRVECYEKGKTFECDCGQGFGVEHDVQHKKCPSCQSILVDRQADDREAPDREEEQTGLNQFL